MKIGWIDFSKEDSQAVDNALLELERKTVDELGLGTVRDGFREEFFPGAALPITRLRYHYFLAYMFADIEKIHAAFSKGPYTSHKESFKRSETALRKLLKSQMAYTTGDLTGIIGDRNEDRYVHEINAYWRNLTRYDLAYIKDDLFNSPEEYFYFLDQNEQVTDKYCDVELSMHTDIAWNLTELKKDKDNLVRTLIKQAVVTRKTENLFHLTEAETAHFEKMCVTRHKQTLLNLLVKNKKILQKASFEANWDKVKEITTGTADENFGRTRHTMHLFLVFNRIMAQAYNYYWSIYYQEIQEPDRLSELYKKNREMIQDVSEGSFNELLSFIESNGWFMRGGGQRNFLQDFYASIKNQKFSDELTHLIKLREKQAKKTDAKLDEPGSGSWNCVKYYYNLNLDMVLRFVRDLHG